MPNEPETPPPPRRTRFARMFGDGSMTVEAGGVDYALARQRLCGSSDDDDVELLEVEVTVVRNHGRPKLQVVREHSARCPTCGDAVYVEVPVHGE